MADECGLKERTVLIEFDSVKQAISAHDTSLTRPAFLQPSIILIADNARIYWVRELLIPEKGIF